MPQLTRKQIRSKIKQCQKELRTNWSFELEGTITDYQHALTTEMSVPKWERI